MRKIERAIRFTAAAVLLGVFAAAPAAAGKKAPAFKPTKPYVEGEIVVQFKEGPESWSAREANQKMGGTVLKTIKKAKLALIQLPPGLDTVKAVEQYRKLPAVVTAEPNYVVSPIKRPKK
jgi:hypothetical protein